MAEYEFFLRSPDLERIGEITNFEKAMLLLKYNKAGKWKLNGFGACPFPKNNYRYGILVRRNGKYIFGGDVRSVIKEVKSDKGTVTRSWEVSGIDDLGRLADRSIIPDPSSFTFDVYSHDIRSGPAETVVIDYVKYHAGIFAMTNRQISGLAVANSEGRGESVTGRARFNNLLDFISQLASMGGLGVQAVYDQTTASIMFSCYVPVDRHDTVTFSVELGNLKGYKRTTAAPKYNYCFVLGQGDMTERAIAMGTIPESVSKWGLIEGTKDQRNEADNTQLYQWAMQALEENGDQSGFSVTPVSSDFMPYKFSEDYNIGDLVSISDDGDVDVDRLTAVQIEYDQKGEKMSPQIGDTTSSTPLADTLSRLGSVEDQIKAMEINK